MRKDIRVPETIVELLQILGLMLRDQMMLTAVANECWTIRPISEWDITHPCIEDLMAQYEWPRRATLQFDKIEHRMSLYFISGHCIISAGCPESEERVEIRVIAEKCDSSESMGLAYWVLKVWMQLKDGTIHRFHFQCHLGYGSDRDFLAESIEKMRPLPPARISFKDSSDVAEEGALE